MGTSQGLTHIIVCVLQGVFILPHWWFTLTMSYGYHNVCLWMNLVVFVLFLDDAVNNNSITPLFERIHQVILGIYTSYLNPTSRGSQYAGVLCLDQGTILAKSADSCTISCPLSPHSLNTSIRCLILDNDLDLILQFIDYTIWLWSAGSMTLRHMLLFKWWMQATSLHRPCLTVA